MGRAFVFPGQGSQAVGMGVDLAGAFATARDVFQEIDEALKQNLSKLMREGPESDLVLTESAAVGHYQRLYQHLYDAALSPADSLDVLASVAEELRKTGGPDQ
jgi:malonyl CoA-acyl carrier protein transacylase